MPFTPHLRTSPSGFRTPITKVQVGVETAFVVGSFDDIQRTLRQAAIGNHAIETGPRAEADAEGQAVLSLSDLTVWAEAAQRRHDPAAADYLQLAQRRWTRVGRASPPALREAA